MDSIDILNEIKQNFVDSSYDINNNRAFPDIRDGLKPSMRACLWAMYKSKFTSDKPHVKSAKISGLVAANLWPHGTQAIYETFVRMSQKFTNNIPEVDFHGANGNQILGGDSFAADRYSEARLAKITEEGMLKGIDKNNVDMMLNFSEDEEWPCILPAVFPRLLVNGAQGIGVSIANVWTLHNFKETADLIIDYLKNNKVDEDGYYPDFPTGGTIVNKDELPAINKTGKGKVIVESSYIIDKKTINFYELPYQVYVEPVIEQIKKAIDDGKITNIKDVYNKSDKKCLSLEVICDKADSVQKVLAQLFAYTDLRNQYNVNQVGMVGKTPTLRNLKEVLEIYSAHNLECIKREFSFDKEKTAERINILEGLLIAIDNIDDVINIIKTSDNTKEFLKEKYRLNDAQVAAILDMKLSKLSKLESDKVKKELGEKREYFNYCCEIVDDENKQKDILIARLKDLVDKFGDERRTKVIQKEIIKQEKSARKKAEPKDVVITVNEDGYIKSMLIKDYKKSKDEIMTCKTVDTEEMIKIFTNKGKIYRVAGKKIKKCAYADKGQALGSILNFDQGEKVIAADGTKSRKTGECLIICTKQGQIKKCKTDAWDGTTANANGMKYMGFKDDSDEVVGICWANENSYVAIETNNGYVLRFVLSALNFQGKTASGVKGIKLGDGDFVKNIAIGEITSDIVLKTRGTKGSLK